MDTLLVLLMSFSVTGVSIWAISRRTKTENRVFRYTSFEDDEHVKHVFLVYSPNFTLAQQDAQKMIALNEIEIEKVEELDAKTFDVIKTPYLRTEKSRVKTTKIA